MGAATIALMFILMNVYLIRIHVYYWSYEQPHDIWRWMYEVAVARASPWPGSPPMQ